MSALQLVQPERGIEPQEAADWERLTDKLKHPNKRVRENAWIARQAMERRWAEEAGRTYQEAAQTRIVERAEAHRGDEEASPEGRIYVVRDGFRKALQDGLLSGQAIAPVDLYEIGVLYRRNYETMQGQIKSNCAKLDRVSSGGGAAPQYRTLEAGDALRVMRRGMTARQVVALDLICGCGVSLRTAQDVMGSSVTKSLCAGLAHAHAAWRGRGKSDLPSQAQMRSADELIQRVARAA